MNRDLSVIAFANGFTLWQYSSKDDIETISQEGYFDPVKHLCAIGDIIIIVAMENKQRCAFHRTITDLEPTVKIGPLK